MIQIKNLRSDTEFKSQTDIHFRLPIMPVDPHILSFVLTDMQPFSIALIAVIELFLIHDAL